VKEYRNYVILGALFIICFAGAVHGSHDNDKELLAFSVDSAKQILAAILTVTTIGVAANRRTTDQNGGQNGKTTTSDPSVTPQLGSGK
jgi:hypothetical protein